MIKKYSARFEELVIEAKNIETTKNTSHTEWGASTNVDHDVYLEWLVKAKNLIARACGESSEHYAAFTEEQKAHAGDTNYSILRRLRPILSAAKSDFQGGFLASIKNLVQAELFDSELEQARELLKSGYKGPSGVVAGIVIETALRTLCEEHNIPIAKLDKMNADFAKADVYNVLQQKRITTLADLRNRAAHGDWNSFTENDVVEMIRDVERFLADYLA